MKKQLLLVMCAALIVSSCSKTNNTLPFSTPGTQTVRTTDNSSTSHTANRAASPFTGSMNYHFVADYDLPCDCTGAFVVGNFYGSGTLSHLGLSTSRIKPCVTPIFESGVHVGDHVAVECAFFVSADGDELDCYTHPYDLRYGPTAAIGTVLVDFTGGTGRFATASGSFTGTVTVPYGTGTATLTEVNGTINY